MQKENIVAGIDIGSSCIKTVIAEQSGGQETARIIGVATTPSFGIRKGVIIDAGEVAKAIEQSLVAAERMSGVQLKKVVVNIGGTEMSFQQTKGVIAVGRADGEVAEDDVNRVLNEAQAVPLPMNDEIVHVIPKKYRLDDHDNIKDPLSMKGVRLEVSALLIQTSSTQIRNIAKCVQQLGIEAEDVVLEPIAAAKAVLNKKQKELGVVLINMGGGTTSLAVYEEGDLLHTAIIPVGSAHITNDIAIGLRTSVDIAEKIKLGYGSARTDGINKKEGIDLSQLDSQEDGIVSRYHVAEIIEARLEEIFELILKELKLIGKAGLLPAGAILVGGGAKMPHVVELAKDKLKLPVQVGFPSGFGGLLDKVDDPSFATVAGLVLWDKEQQHRYTDRREKKLGDGGAVFKKAGTVIGKIQSFASKFLP